MKSNMPLIMSWLAAYEGGFVYHRRDPGGPTNRGVTQRVYNAYRARRGAALRSVKELTRVEHDTIYRRQYWNAIRGDDLPSGLDATIFDFAVNSGPARSAKTLQRVLGVAADGQIGEVTLAAIARVDRKELIIKVNAARMDFLRRLSTFDTFGVGWTRRVMGDKPGIQMTDLGVVERSLVLAKASHDARARAIPLPRKSAPGKGDGASLSFLGRLIEAIAAFISALSKKGETA